VVGKLTVLVIDDDPVILELLRVNFEIEGFDVICATDGEDGLRRAQADRPDVVISDIMMPRRDGLQLLTELKADPATEDLPVILLSAKALVADVQALERAGATFVAIPCNTALVWVDAMRAAVGIEVLDTVDETVAAARVAVPGLARLGVRATDGTLPAGAYARSAERAGVELVVPGPEVQREVMSVIYDGVKAGRPVPRAHFDALVAHLVEKGAQVVALGCTELSVLRVELGVEDPRVVDSIDAVARAAVLRAGGRLRP